MILSSISYLDCLVFLVFLTPQLIYHVGIIRILAWLIWHVFNLAIVIPYKFLTTRFTTSLPNRPPFTQQATSFQDIIIRYVRYGFAHLPATFGRVFLSKAVSLPFIRWRMLRHGILRKPVQWREINTTKFKALYIPPPDSSRPPTNVLFYLHGGGFSMGSSYFYLEFLLAWYEIMMKHGELGNPAVLAVEYSLVPDAVYPVQLDEVTAAYEYTKDVMQGKTEHICLAGDSAGATLVLSLLLSLSANASSTHEQDDWKPGFCILISPWVSVISGTHEDTASDYLNAETLELYGGRYVDAAKDNPHELEIASPGSCTSSDRWAAASPKYGYMVTHGTEEVLAKDARKLVKKLQAAGQAVVVEPLKDMVHAWPVAALYLAESPTRRLKCLYKMVDVMYSAMMEKDIGREEMYSDLKEMVEDA